MEIFYEHENYVIVDSRFNKDLNKNYDMSKITNKTHLILCDHKIKLKSEGFLAV